MHEFDLWATLFTIAGVFAVLMGTCAFLIYVERKVAAWVQDRVGPNRVGPAGIFQSLADGLKFLFKEEIIPDHVDKPLYLLAPCIAMAMALLAFAVVPFGATGDPSKPEFQTSYQFVLAPGLDIGIVFLFAVTSLTVYAILLAGWASNSKYSLFGGLRSSAQVISYEIPLGLSVVGVVLLSSSLNLETIIWKQAEHGVWNIVYQPLAFLIFATSAFAETNRVPFDLPEAEQELVGGYHTEYSAMKFAMFFLGEYTSLVTSSFVMVVLFFGGWHLPWIAEGGAFWLIKLIVFAGKVTAIILFFMLIRWTLPRFRFDQLMGLAWRVLIPLAVVNLVCVMVVKEMGAAVLWLLPISLALLVGSAWLGTVAGSEAPRPKDEALVLGP